MTLARFNDAYAVTSGNAIPLNAWVRPESTIDVTVTSSQALFVVRINDDGFWGFLYTPSTSSVTYPVSNDCVYCLFTKPSSFIGSIMCIALFSPVFSEPVLLINGTDRVSSTEVSANMSYYKFDIRPYFDQ